MSLDKMREIVKEDIITDVRPGTAIPKEQYDQMQEYAQLMQQQQVASANSATSTQLSGAWYDPPDQRSEATVEKIASRVVTKIMILLKKELRQETMGDLADAIDRSVRELGGK